MIEKKNKWISLERHKLYSMQLFGFIGFRFCTEWLLCCCILFYVRHQVVPTHFLTGIFNVSILRIHICSCCASNSCTVNDRVNSVCFYFIFIFLCEKICICCHRRMTCVRERTSHHKWAKKNRNFEMKTLCMCSICGQRVVFTCAGTQPQTTFTLALNYL